MMQPLAYHEETDRAVPFTEAPDDALRACIEAPLTAFVCPTEASITKSIAAAILMERAQ